MKSEPSIQYALQDQCMYFKLIGALRYSSQSAWEPFVSRIIDKERPQMVVLDLTETTFLDSTHLGIIASTAVKLREISQQKPLIVTSNEDITTLLASMGFEHYFEILDESASKDALTYDTIDLPTLTPASMRDVMLQAHKNLADMNKNNREAFKDVIALLEQEKTASTET